jgi:hypothetical protein
VLSRVVRTGSSRWLGLFWILLIAAGAKAEAQSDDLAAKSKTILSKYCYACHGKEGRAEGGFNVAIDLKKLVESKRVVPGKSAESKLFRKIVEGNMPPEDDFEAAEGAKPPPKPKPEEVAILRTWIDAGAPGELVGTKIAAGFIKDSQLETLISDDLKTLPPRVRRFTRYFTLVHLANAGDNADQLVSYHHGLSKLVNSLSWSRRVIVPAAVGSAGIVVRIDLRDYGWTRDSWGSILDTYPFAVLPTTAIGKAILKDTDCELPYVRADWFVYAASRPPLYHELLRLPPTDTELERQLHVDVDANIQQEFVARAAFSASGVSRNNRMIERHESGYGAYWKSYDFAGSTDRKNLFANPLGPGDGEHDFSHDGGEIIFSLPNGLQAYMLVDSGGKRIDQGPTTIVRDAKQSDGSVVNGISCMSCHNRGMIEKTDQVRDVVKRAASLPAEVTEMVLALYPPKDRFESLLREDTDRYSRAVKATGANLSQTEPVYALARQFEADLDIKRAAAESGLEPTAFRALLKRTPALAQSVGPLISDGSCKRDAFVEAFPRIAEARQLTMYASADRVVDAAKSKPVELAARPASALAPAGRRKEYAVEKLADLAPQNWGDRDRFRDVGPAGTILVGARVTYIERFRGNKIRSLQPIYRSGRNVIEGNKFGEAVGVETTAIAKPGYAVGAVNTHTGLTVDGFEMIFMRIKGDRLDPSDSYKSPWLGDQNGGGPGSVSSNGNLVVGLLGRSNKELLSLGLVILK